MMSSGGGLNTIRLLRSGTNKKESDMLQFQDLVFKDHSTRVFGVDKVASVEFPNGYGVSVITGGYVYGSETHPYEVAVLLGGLLCYDTHITDGVIGHLDSLGVTRIMEQIQKLEEEDSESYEGRRDREDKRLRDAATESFAEVYRSLWKLDRREMTLDDGLDEALDAFGVDYYKEY